MSDRTWTLVVGPREQSCADRLSFRLLSSIRRPVDVQVRLVACPEKANDRRSHKRLHNAPPAMQDAQDLHLFRRDPVEDQIPAGEQVPDARADILAQHA